MSGKNINSLNEKQSEKKIKTRLKFKEAK